MNIVALFKVPQPGIAYLDIVAYINILYYRFLCNKIFSIHVHFKIGSRKEEDATINLFTRQPYYQQYTHIINYDYLQLQKANRNIDNIKNITCCQLDMYSLKNILKCLIQLNY